MNVYIIFEKCVKCSPPVTLQNCLKPTVGTFSEDRIEPALWFKVLLLDSILIDCERRQISVNFDKDGSSRDLQECQYGKVLDFFKDKEKLFEDSILYDFDPTIDELFDSAISVFNSLSIDAITEHGNTQTFENLLKVLHVFILPEISLRTKDKTAVEEVRKEIEKDYEKIEDLIQKKDKTKRNTENSLSKQRQEFLLSGNFSSNKYVASLDDEFLKVFLHHLDKDIRKLNEVLLNCDSQVSSLRNSVSESDGALLASYRSERSEINSAVERAIVAREEIKNVISRKHVKKKFKKNKLGTADFHELYVKTNRQLEVVDNEVRKLIMSKIKLSGVREAALLTLHEIDSDGISYGFHRKKGSFEMEADIFDPNKKPEEWATLTERVKTYLQVKQLGFRCKYEAFCSLILRRCQQLYDESKLFGPPPLSPGTAEFVNTIGSEVHERRSMQDPPFHDETHRKAAERVANDTDGHTPLPFRNSFTLSRSRGYSVRWSTACISKQKCELICQEVIDHVSRIALDLAIEIMGTDKPIPHSYLNKLYVCYEEHVSSELLPALCELYEKSYEEKCYSLASWLRSFPNSEVGFEEKTISGLFQVGAPLLTVPESDDSNRSSIELPDQDETMVKSAMGPGCTDTLGSIDLQELSLDEMYTRINNQSRDMPLSFAGALDGLDYDTMPEDICDTTSRKTVNSKELNDSVSNTSSDGEAAGVSPESDLPTYEETVKSKGRSEQDPPPYSTLPPERNKFYQSFEQFFTLVKEEESACTLFSKLRHMTHINKYIEKQITMLRDENGKGSMACTDDILDVIILLLCRLEAKWLLKLYAHLNLMIDLSPSFMQGNAHDYSLVNFSVAYQHLFDKKQVEHKPAGTGK